MNMDWLDKASESLGMLTLVISTIVACLVLVACLVYVTLKLLGIVG